MNRAKKSKWLILLVVLLVLLIFSVWYMRPITIYDLEQDFHPRAIAVSVTRVGTEPEVEQYSLFVQEGEAGFDEMLRQIADLRFSRYPTNVLLQFFPGVQKSGPSVTAIKGYDYHIDLAIQGPDEGEWPVRLQYDMGRWHSCDLERGSFLPIRSVGQSGKEIGDALAESITRLSAPSK